MAGDHSHQAGEFVKHFTQAIHGLLISCRRQDVLRYFAHFRPLRQEFLCKVYALGFTQILLIVGTMKVAAAEADKKSKASDWDVQNRTREGEVDLRKEGEVKKIATWIFPQEDGNLAVKGGGLLKFCSSRGALCYGGKKADIEQLWRELFFNPTEWQDHRFCKVNPRFPDFKHQKQAHKALWVSSGWIPPWVKEKLAALPPGTIQLSTFSWNKRLSRYARAGQYEKTMELFQQMQQDGQTADRFTFLTVLKACASLGLLEYGRLIHAMMQPGLEADLFLGSSLVDMYAKCDSIEEAVRVFNQMPVRDVVAWNAMILGYVKCGEGQKALELFDEMQAQGVDPNSLTFVGVLNGCAGIAALEVGRHTHEEITHRGYESDVVVGTCLINMYAKCGSIEEAERVFKEMPTRNVVAWNAMIFGYVKCEKGLQALELFEQMKGQELDPDSVTFVGVLNACASAGALEGGRRVHEEITRRGYELDVVVGTCLIDMYSKCGTIEEAERVFIEMPTRDVVAWKAMIFGCVKCGGGQKALDLFDEMQRQGVDPDSLTFVGVLNACASIGALEGGRHAHEEIIRRGFESDMVVQNCLVDMYAKCGSIDEAETVFKEMPTQDVVAWNAMIFGYVKCGTGQKALELFEEMQVQGVDPDNLTFVGILKACACIGALEGGRHAHEEIIRRGCESDLVVRNCLVDMYAKCGSIKEAERVFKETPTRDVVAWNAMIFGYVKCGGGQKALELFEEMQHLGLQPDSLTFFGVLNACATIGALDGGRQAHEEIIRRGYELDVILGTCLIHMYAKCGSIREAERVFNEMPRRDVVSWNAMLAAYGSHGYSRKALETFERMCKVAKVDSITFISLLSACSHGGLVDDGLEYFKSMNSVYSISPMVEHYACVVDILGRAGCLGEAEELINSMPMDPNASVWMSLLGACRAHVNLEVGESCAKRLLELEPENASGYVLLSDIYVATGKWESSAKVHQEWLDRGMKKIPGHTWIEVNKKVHLFLVNDNKHPQIEFIHAELKRLSDQMKEAGFAPDLRSQLHCVVKDSKEFYLCEHSEKLAIGFGLISTYPGTTIHLANNLPACGNCHKAAKSIAKIVKRTIVLRDVNYVHRFEHGFCSCGDYW